MLREGYNARLLIRGLRSLIESLKVDLLATDAHPFVAAISKSRTLCHVERPARLRNRGYSIWWEEGDAELIWQGRVQHAASGDNRYFQTIAELLDFVEQHAGHLSA